MYMAEKLDAGNIISQRAIAIEEEDHTGGMFDKLSIVGRDLLKETLPALEAGTNDSIVQDESLVTYARNISREQERIDWTKSARDVYNQVRGLHPWPVAYTTINDANVKVWWAQVGGDTTELPGTVVDIQKDKFGVATGDGVLYITDLQPAGKKRMSATDYLRGTGSTLQIGDRFE